MGIDTFTLVAQIINLVILIWLLKRFLYTPILRAVDARQAKIAERLNTAREQADKAIQQQQLYEQKIETFEADRQKMFEEARKESDHIKAVLLGEAKEEVAQSRKRWQNDLMNEKKAFDNNLRNLILEQFKLFADQSMKQMAGVTLQSLIEDQFKRKLAALPAKEKKAFAEQVRQTERLTLVSAVKMTPDQKKDMAAFLKEVLDMSDDVRVTFKDDSALLSGIELLAGEQIMSWSMRHYLDQFETNLDTAMTGLIQQE